MHITADSAFGKAITNMIVQERIVSIVESGTHNGTGSTTVLATALAKVPNSILRTIELDEKLVLTASENLSHVPSAGQVVIYPGLSIPFSHVPNEMTVLGRIMEYNRFARTTPTWPQQTLADAQMYLDELDKPYAVDNLLYRLIDAYKPRLVFLDSAGSTGWEEWTCIKSLGCYEFLALDDTNHLKHWKTERDLMLKTDWSLLYHTDEAWGRSIWQRRNGW